MKLCGTCRDLTGIWGRTAADASNLTSEGGGSVNLSKTKLSIMAVVLAVALIEFGQHAYSQTETGQITGTVFDPSGAIIPNAKVSVKSTTTGLERQTTTTAAGTDRKSTRLNSSHRT